MNNREIEAILYKCKYTKNIFYGCHPIDHLNRCLFKSKKLKIFVFNTDVSGGAGKHWVLVLIKNNTVRFYDSLNLYDLIVKKLKISQSIPYRIQALTSNVCGAHVILLAILFAIGVPHSEIFKRVYRKNRFSYNDLLARRFTRNYTKELFSSSSSKKHV